MNNNQNTGFLQGLGISAGLISAPILIGIGIVLTILLICCACFFLSTLGSISNTIPTPILH